jgi:predicted dehydrogenase
MTVRIGVVGTGFGARVVAPVFDGTPGCEVVEVVSARDDAGVANLCDRHDVDLLTIHSPPFLHAAHVRRGLVSGHAVLCDKPFGVDALEAETLVAAAEAADCLHLLNFEFRYDPMRQRVRELVSGGAVGDPEHVTWTHLSAGSVVPPRRHGWLFERASGGGWIGAWASHAVDMLRWTFGEIIDARGLTRTIIAERPDANGVVQTCDAEDAFTAWLRTESDTTIAIDSSFAARANVAPRFVVCGTEGVLECVADARIVVRREGEAPEEHERPATDGDPHLVPMQGWAEVVRDAVEEGIAPAGVPTFTDGLACSRVLDAIGRRAS